jgi:uncharacterized protein YhaN
MRLLIFLIVLAPALAAESPAESFRAFVEAVLADDKPEAERRAVLERYFDFDTWLANKEASEGKQYAEDDRAQMKKDWLTLFLSAEFSESYRARSVQIVEEPQPAGDAAELIITMIEPGSEKPGKFRVLMMRSGEHWRWHSIPRLAEAEPATPKTPDEQLAAVVKALEELREQSAQIAERIRQLETERKRIESQIAETNAGQAPYSTPMTTAHTLGNALSAEDVEAVLRAHADARRGGDKEKLAAKLKRESARLASWEPLDSTLQGADGAFVRVRVRLWANQGVKSRTITLALRKVGDEWLVDEEP